MKATSSVLAIPNLRGFVAVGSWLRKGMALAFSGALSLAIIGTEASAASSYTWNQTGSAAWGTAANWSPDRNTPATDDILLFNNGATTTPTGVPTQTIGKLQVSGNTTVNFQAGAAATLTISAAAADSFTVASGSLLNVNGANALTTTLATGATGSISGSIILSNANHRLTAADTNGITFNSGATFTQGRNCNGSVFGTANLNSVIFASGSAFISQDGANPFGAGAPNSVVVFQTGSLFSLRQNAAPSLSGRTYANFEIDGNSVANISGAFANPWTVDSINIKSGSQQSWTHSTGIGTGTLNVHGNLTVDGQFTFLTNSSQNYTLKFNGTSAQAISGAGTITLSSSLAPVVVDNTTGVTLQRNLTIGSSLTLNGKLAIGANTLAVGGTGTTVAAAGTLTGSGTISGPVILNGTISPGASPGTLNTASETWNGGGHYTWQINKVDSTEGADPGWDLINITGGLTINATSANKFNIDIASLTLAVAAGDVASFDNTTSQSWRILKTTTGITGFDAAAFNLNSDNFSNPLGSGLFTLQLANGNDLILGFIALPTITDFTPQSGLVGSDVTISGANLDSVTAVAFNGSSALFSFSSSTHQITATVPSGATTGKISVTNPAGTGMSTGDFTVIKPPTITGFTPTTGAVGAEVTISGTYLDTVSDVKFNGVSSTAITHVSAGSIKATLPTGATTGKISVTNPADTATSTSDFTVIKPPTITSFTPTTGAEGVEVTISGTELDSVTDVKFNTTSSTAITHVSAISIKATVPTGATTGKISVTNPAGTVSSTDDFVITTASSIFVDAAYAGKPDGTMVNFPDDGNTGPHTIGVDAFATIQAGVNASTAGRYSRSRCRHLSRASPRDRSGHHDRGQCGSRSAQYV